MKIYQLQNIVAGFASINFEGVDMGAVLKEGKIDLLQGGVFTWDKSNGTEISDCPFFIGSFPIFNTRKLGTALAGTNVKTATFTVEGISYTAVSAPQLSGEIINRSLSVFRTFRSGKIMSVSKYVFNAGFSYPAIFTPKEYPTSTFCDADVARELIDCDFDQLSFKDCLIK